MTGSAVDTLEVDIAVIGSGAAGLTAALTASVLGLNVLLCEKEGQVGGTTATSGGSCWVPLSRQARQRNVDDSPERVLAYLESEVGTPDTDGRRRAFVDGAPRAFEFVEANSALQFALPEVYPDYHPAQPGAALGGRTLQPVPFDGRRLGAAFAIVRRPNRGQTVLGGLMVNRPEARLLVRPLASWRAFAFTARTMARFAVDRLRYPRGTRLLLGNAMVGALLFTLRERGVPVWTSTAMQSLLVEQGRVAGAVVAREGRTMVVRARRGVVLATGGFTSNETLRRELGPDFPAAWALSATGANGDGLSAARAIGAAIDTSGAAPMFFMPASVLRPGSSPPFAFPHIIADRARPGLIAVDPKGRRFVNEADSYHDFVVAMYRSGIDRAYLVCDSRSLRTYGVGLIRPVWQWLSWYERAGYIVRGPTLAVLAQRIGVPAESLTATLAAYNDDAQRGVDSAFGKGDTALNRFNGDPAVKPNPCLASIEAPPFIAVEVRPAAIGASAGLRTDAAARVLASDGAPMSGLYACGNDQASIMRGSYPGPGITLGPAITFAFLAMEHAAAHPLPTARMHLSQTATTMRSA